MHVCMYVYVRISVCTCVCVRVCVCICTVLYWMGWDGRMDGRMYVYGTMDGHLSPQSLVHAMANEGFRIILGGGEP